MDGEVSTERIGMMEVLNMKQSAQYLRITRSTMYRWIEKYGLAPDEKLPGGRGRVYFYKNTLDTFKQKHYVI